MPLIVTSVVVELKPVTDSLKVTEQLKLVLLDGVALGRHDNDAVGAVWSSTYVTLVLEQADTKLPFVALAQKVVLVFGVTVAGSPGDAKVAAEPLPPATAFVQLLSV